MGSSLIQILILAGVAIFLILRLRSILGTRDGYEAPPLPKPTELKTKKTGFEVIEGGGPDPDIADHIAVDSDAGKAFTAMKKVEPGFAVGEFLHGARQAYEIILMAYENGELPVLEKYLSPEVYESFSTAVFARADKGLTVEASFIGIREVKLMDASFDTKSREADITVRFTGELTSAVRDPDGEIVEGDPKAIKRQKDVWTFSRKMGGGDPNWLLVATGN